MSTTGTGRGKCWGCECEMPRDDRGMHNEPTEWEGVVYSYVCLAWDGGDDASVVEEMAGRGGGRG